MSNFYPAARITANTQESFEYAIYVIFSSYFKKAVCTNRVREASMHINYVETALALQYEMEEFCDKEAQKLFSMLPDWISECTVTVSFIRSDKHRTEIRFKSDSFILRLIGEYRKKGGIIRSEFWHK